jgi:hypothetical protein
MSSSAVSLKQRRNAMFAHGADEHEVSQCLELNRSLLIKAGAKAQNLPSKADARVLFLCALQPKPFAIARKWFAENLPQDDLPSPVAACAILSGGPEQIPTDKVELRLLWRSVLTASVQPSCTQEVADFINGASSVRTVPAAAPPNRQQEPDVTTGDVEEALVLARGQDGIPGSGRLVPLVISGLLAAGRGDAQLVMACSRGLRALGSAVGKGFIPVLDAAMARRSFLEHGYAGFSVSRARKLSEIVCEDTDEFVVIGTRTRTLLNGQIFIRIEAIVDKDGLVELTPDEARLRFAESGDATAFPGTVGGHSANVEGLAVWRVMFAGGDHKTQFVASAYVARVHDVVRVPHASTENDKVRAWLLDMYQPITGVCPVFQLSDGLIIKLPAENGVPSRSMLETPLQAYRSLGAVAFGSRTIVTGPFPAAELKYDCAAYGTLVKRLFVSRGKIEQFPAISKTQLQQLAELAENEASDGLLRQSAERVLGNVDAVFAARETVVEALAEILQHPAVQSEVAIAKDAVLEEYRALCATEQGAITALKAEKEKLGLELVRIREANKKEVANLSKELRTAFDRAGSEGAKTLAGLALYKAVLGSVEPPAAGAALHPPEVSSSSAPVTIVRAQARELLTADEIGLALSRRAELDGIGFALLTGIAAAASSQGVVALTGGRLPEIVLALSAVVAGGVSCVVSVTGDMFGPSDLMNSAAMVDAEMPIAMTLGDFIEMQQKNVCVPIVRLQGVNRAPPESFLPELLSLARTVASGGGFAWTDKNSTVRFLRAGNPIVFILDFASGRSTFPIIAPLAFQVPLFDTGFAWDDAADPDPGRRFHDSRANVAAWAGLVGEGLPAGDGPCWGGLPARRLVGAAFALGNSGDDARLLALAAFGPGRRAVETLVAQAKESLSLLVPNIVSYMQAMDGKLTKGIFEMEEGSAA